MKPDYRVETFNSTEEFQAALILLDDPWRLHSFAPGQVQRIVAVFWSPVLEPVTAQDPNTVILGPGPRSL